MVDALNAVDMLDYKMTKTDASLLIHQDWHMSDKWLKGVKPLSHRQEEEEVRIVWWYRKMVLLSFENYITEICQFSVQKYNFEKLQKLKDIS